MKEVTIMQEKTIFESDIMSLAGYVDNMEGIIQLINIYSKDGIKTLQYCNRLENNLDDNTKYMIRYEKFLKKLKSKFAYDIKYDEFMSQISLISNANNQIRLSVANSEFKNIDKISKEMKKNYDKLRNSFAPMMSLPYILDYSNISKLDWRLVGIPGLHYKSKIFISYPFRKQNPANDENQQMIDNYLIPLLENLNIEPITARSELDYQDLIDDKIIELIKDCDGIIGLFTHNDDVTNIEHELSFNNNIIAICKEEGAKAPSMRYSRLMLNFNRGEMGYLVLNLLKTLKNKKMFFTKI